MRKLLVALLVVLALLAVVDRVAVRVADRVLAGQLADQLGGRPTVDVRGFPFLTQLLGGRYGDVRLATDTVQRSGVTVHDVTAQLVDAEVPLSSVVGGGVDRVPVRRVVVSGRVDYAQLERLAGRGLSLGPATDGRVTVSGTVRVAGRDVLGVSAVAGVRLDGGVLLLTAGDVRVADVAPPAALAGTLRDALGLRLQLPSLPYDVTLQQVVGGPEGITVSGTARDVVLQ